MAAPRRARRPHADHAALSLTQDAADSEEEEDFTVRATDAIVLVARTDVEEGHSVLEVHLYEEDTGNFYVHHDYPLSAYPLCLAWMSMHPAGAAASAAAGPAAVADAAAAAAPEGPGNYAAVGTFAQGIEIWNLDLLDAPEPTCTLGGVLDEKVDTKARKRVTRLAPDSHKKEVMALSWNAAHRCAPPCPRCSPSAALTLPQLRAGEWVCRQGGEAVGRDAGQVLAHAEQPAHRQGGGGACARPTRGVQRLMQPWGVWAGAIRAVEPC